MLKNTQKTIKEIAEGLWEAVQCQMPVFYDPSFLFAVFSFSL